MEVIGTKSMTTFEIDVPESGSYYINFWLCPARLSDGLFSEYEVLANGSPIGKIRPTKDDWQAISLDGNQKVNLQRGTYSISVVGKIPDIPSVEHIRLSCDSEKARINDAAYQSYKQEAIEAGYSQVDRTINDLWEDADTTSVQASRKVLSFPLPAQTNPPYDGSHYTNLLIRYTFYKTVYFQQNQNVTLSATGLNYFYHVLEFFSSSSPGSYSWTKRGTTTTLNVTIPQTGYYYVKVRAFDNATMGTCNLNINNQNYYNGVMAYSFGMVGDKDTNHLYNSFTCHASDDPRIWVEEGDIPGIIVAYNDDYSSNTSDFDWEDNSRVKRYYSNSNNSILFSTFGSYSPTCTCDVYCNLFGISLSGVTSDNIIQSAPFSANYNCYSWAGGIYTDWVEPGDDFSGYSTDPLGCFDDYFSSDRYPGCSHFTRVGATEANSTVDLWGEIENGILKYRHASLKKGADNNAHGFDWESKLGPSIRVYHPRYVSLQSYGSVVEHYRRTDSGTASITFEEAIANGSAVLENVRFTDEETEFIASRTDGMDREVLSKFYILYERWQKVWDTSTYSSSVMISNCDEYRELLAYCQVHKELVYPVFSILNEKTISAICLLKDLTLKDNRPLLEKVFESNRQRKFTDKGAQIVRFNHANAMLYAKELIKSQMQFANTRENNNETTGISYSNTDKYEVRQVDNTISLSFNISKASRVRADITDLRGNIIAEFVNDKSLQPNSYLFQRTVPKGIYLVRYILNGNVNVKKIRVD